MTAAPEMAFGSVSLEFELTGYKAMATQTHAVTGAFGYSGKYIANRLLDAGHNVITFTNSPDRANPFGGRVRPFPFNFGDPEELEVSLRGVSVLYNTYWVRFNHVLFKHQDAVANTETLFLAAKAAGVERIVHVSITNPSAESELEYFSGKAKLEESLRQLGVPFAILRPTVLFGEEDILINNIAWVLRRLPVFGVFGSGNYRIQPIHVDDLALLAVLHGDHRNSVVVDAIGPETYTFRALVQVIAEAIGKKRPIVPVPPVLGYAAGWLLGKCVGDIMITREEIRGLMADLLYVDSPASGATSFKEWVQSHADTLGVRYASELARRVDRSASYQ